MSGFASTLPIHLRGVYETQIASSNSRPNHWRDIVGDVLDTNAIREKMVLMSGLRTATKVNDGELVSFDEITAPYEKNFATQIFAVGVRFTEKQLKTDQSGKLKRIGEEFGKSLYYQKEVMCADIINLGTSVNGIDGVPLFSASHPHSTGTWSNLSTAAALDATSLKLLLTNRKAHKTLKGQPWLDLGEGKLIVPDALDFVAKILIKSTREAGVADNDMNPIPEIVRYTPSNRFLTSTTSFTFIPMGKANPIFLLDGNIDRPIREDEEIDSLSKKMVAAQDHTTGWLYPAGVQHNAGL